MLGGSAVCGALESVLEELGGVDDTVVLIGDGWLCKIVMAELNGFGVEKRIGIGIGNLGAAVVFEGGADVEAITVAGVPGAVGVDRVVD